jgi:hypothetical protein
MPATGDWAGHYLFVGGSPLAKSGAEGQMASATLKISRLGGQPLQSCTVHDAGALDLNDAIPAELIALPARTAAPRLAPCKPPPPATAPRPTAPAHSTQHHPCTAVVRKHPLPAQLPADALSVPPRYSHVSCVICARLGASDAAPSSPIELPACTAAPRLAPRRTSTTRSSPTRNRPSPQQATSSVHCRRSQASAHSAAARRCTQRTTEVQRRQLRHLRETRCQRRCPS